MITNFRKRNVCEGTGIITAVVDDGDHKCAIVNQNGTWIFMSAARIITKDEQEYCSEMNFKAERAADLISRDAKHLGESSFKKWRDRVYLSFTKAAGY